MQRRKHNDDVRVALRCCLPRAASRRADKLTLYALTAVRETPHKGCHA